MGEFRLDVAVQLGPGLTALVGPRAPERRQCSTSSLEWCGPIAAWCNSIAMCSPNGRAGSGCPRTGAASVRLSGAAPVPAPHRAAKPALRPLVSQACARRSGTRRDHRAAESRRAAGAPSARLSGGEKQRVALGPRAACRGRGCCCWTSRSRPSISRIARNPAVSRSRASGLWRSRPFTSPTPGPRSPDARTMSSRCKTVSWSSAARSRNSLLRFFRVFSRFLGRACKNAQASVYAVEPILLTGGHHA